MRRAFQAAVVVMLSGIALTFFGLDEALAQPALARLSDIDIAGVKLGMTVDQAVATLQASDPHYVIKKNYWANDYTIYGVTGYPTDQLASFPGSLTPKFVFLTDLVAEDGLPPCSDDQGAASYYWDGCINPDATHPQLPYHLVHIWFSPVIGQERVIAIKRTDSFRKNDADLNEDLSKLPSLSIVLADINKKYPEPSYGPDATEMNWAFDVKGRLISPSMAKALSLQISYGGQLPITTSSTDGSILSINYMVASQNDQLVETIDSSLFDGAALYNSVSEGHAAYETQKAKLDAQDAAGAAKNSVSPNL